MKRGLRSSALKRAGLAALLAAGLTLSASSAMAQSAADKAAAEALFDEGVQLLKSGDYDAACKKLESSQRVDPGIGTLLYLADCYEKSGRTASAWATFREAASEARAAGQDKRADAGLQRAKRLEPLLSRLTINVDAKMEELEGLTVSYGGEQVRSAVWGTAIPVDPGEYQIVAEAPGYAPYKAMVTVNDQADQASATIPMLQPSGGAVAAAPEDGEPGPAATPEDSGNPGQGMRTTGLVLGGVGVAGLGLGTAFGIIAISKNDEAKNDHLCTDASCPTQEGIEATNAARDAATISTVGLIAGGALLATGAVLYFTAPKKKDVARLSVSPTAGGAFVQLGGSF